MLTRVRWAVERLEQPHPKLTTACFGLFWLEKPSLLDYPLLRPAEMEFQRYRQMGFTRGFSLGEEVGWRDGYQLGLQRGAQIATELGFYQGFVHAWITVLEREEIAKQRKMVALKALLEMTKNFPQVNIADEDMFEKLHKIRAKFKQVVAILNINTQESELHPEGEPSSPRPEMSF